MSNQKAAEDILKQALDILTKGRIRLIVNQSFFGALSMKLILTPMPHTIPFRTLATDGIYLYYDADFVLQYKDRFDIIMGLVCHEVMHCAMGHMKRFSSLPTDDHTVQMHRLIACDLAINPIIRDAGAEMFKQFQVRMSLPEDAAFPAIYGLPDYLSAEEYYHLLKQKSKQQDRPHHCGGVYTPDQQSGGKGGDGKEEGEGGGGSTIGIGAHQMNQHPMNQQQLDELDRDWKVSVFEAAQAAKQTGNLPAGLERLVEGLRKPSIDWKDALRRFVMERSKDDYRMFPPNRRFIHTGNYMPSMNANDTLGEIVVAIDTSGSIGRDELEAFFSEIAAICEETRPRKLHVISCDADVHTHQEFTPAEYPLEIDAIKVGGGGGTNFYPVFDYVEQEMIEPACLVFLTDMYGTGFPTAYYPVMWCATTDQVAPVESGETVRMKV